MTPEEKASLKAKLLILGIVVGGLGLSFLIAWLVN